MVGADVWDVFEGLDGSPFGAAYRKAMEHRETVVVRGRAAREGVWLEAIALPTDLGIQVIIHDISAEEEANQRLRESEARNASQARLLDVATDAIIVRNLDHTIAYWNLSAARLYGWTPEEAVGSDIRQLIYEDLTDFDAAVAEALREGAWWGDLKQVTKSGHNVIVESRWSVVRDDEGKPITLFSVNTDVTEARSQRESMFNAQRMESLGTLASGIAHDLNNVLAPILMSAQLLEKDEHDPGRLQILRAVETGAKRGAELVRQVLAFARGAEGRRDVLQVSSLIDEVRTFLTDTIDKSIRISAHVPPDLWPIAGDSTQLIQVLLNLAVNARDAMPDGGQLIFRARNSTLDRPLLSVTHLARPGKYVVVEVEDNGIGIEPSVLSKVFEPFFTTKEIGQGTGLGLATSVANVRGHGGFMQVDSELGRGSKFLLYLPAALDGALVAVDEQSPDLDLAPRGDGELILIVDDEPAILELTSQTLEAFGYRTAIASNGVQAIEYIAGTTGHVDLVLTDMMMPIMDGATTAATVLRRFPLIPIIGMSGLDANGAPGRTKALGVVNFLSKPFTASELHTAVAHALSGARGGRQ
jgi:PAS domain S-box-containing protein